MSIPNARNMKKLTRALLLVGGVGDSADVRYATGFSSIDPTLYFARRNKRCLIVPALEKSRAIQESKGKVRVVTPSELLENAERGSSISEWALAFLKREGVRAVSVSNRCPAGLMAALTGAGIRVHVIRDRVFPERAQKKMHEVRNIAHCQRAAVAAMRAAIAFLKSCTPNNKGRLVDKSGKPATSESVRQVILSQLREYDCSSDYIIVAGGQQAAAPHAPGYGVLRANEPIVLDIFPQSLRTGYWGDLTRTVVRGRATPEVKRMYQAVKAAHAAAMRAARAGVAVRDVHRAASRTLEARGYKTSLDEVPEGFIHSTGHGVGLSVHEPPFLCDGKGRLRAGNVVTIEPGLYYRHIGGVRIEDTVLITRHGARKLARCPYTLEI